MRQLVALILITGSGWVGFSVAERMSAPKVLELRVEPVKPAFADSRSVRFRVLIGNSSEDCRTTYFDRVVASEPSPRRPVSVLTLAIRNANGRVVKPTSRTLPNWGAMASRELMRLDCWESFGREIMPESAEWGFRLEPGRYTVSGRLEIRARSFFEAHAQLLEEAARATGKEPGDLLSHVAEGVAESKEMAFEVENGK